MPRTFNTTGPCDARFHYLLPPEARLPQLQGLIDERLYFVLHAARQTGKTTAMLAFASRLRRQGVVALHITIETSQGAEAVEVAEPRWLSALHLYASSMLPEADRPPAPATVQGAAVGARLTATLRQWCEAVSPRPVVLLIDEADVVSGPAMVNLLRQLRAGFHTRPEGFPASIVLIGMRDLRDYLTQAKDGEPVNPGSPFNVKAESLTLRNFTAAEVGELYAQHTSDTGQVFEPEAAARAYELTQGQPFLVNALARHAVMQGVTDRTQPVTRAHIDQAKEALILSRTTHLDSLSVRLRDARVAPIISEILLGDNAAGIDANSDDYQYVQDLGLVRRGLDGPEIANPIYREVIGRELSFRRQENLPRPWWPWKRPNGRLDMEALVNAFLQWWRENADMIRKHDNTPYTEAMAHLAFMGFLQRVINGSEGPVDPPTGGRGAGAPVPEGHGHPGGGTVEREYAAGRGRVDLIVTYGPDRFLIELKRVPPEGRTLKQIQQKGVEQISAYLDTLGLHEGWLIIFDQRPGLTWRRRMWRKERVIDGRTLHLRGS